MVTTEQLQKIGLPGLMSIAIVFLYSELRTAQEDIKELQQKHDEFVEMVINRYHIPLVK